MRLLAIAAVGLALGGCASFLHFSDPTTQKVTCEITSAVLPLLEDLAVMLGIPLQTVESLYGDGCATAAAKGMSQAEAEKFGLARAQVMAMRMVANPAKGTP